MKTIFLVITLVVLQLKAHADVDKSVGGVDKPYQHQLICKAIAANQEYEFNLKWKNKLTQHDPPGRAPFIDKDFSYELKKMTTGLIWSGSYTDFFNQRATVTDLPDHLILLGDFQMYKRIGVISNSAEIYFDKQNGQFYFSSIHLKARETFIDTRDYCKPSTRLCGWEPGTKFLNLAFENSTCEYTEL